MESKVCQGSDMIPPFGSISYTYRNGEPIQSAGGYCPHTSTRFIHWNSATNEQRKLLPELYLRREQCCGCTACMASCPTGAIAMDLDEEGFDYPVVDAQRCVGCKSCERACAFKKSQVDRVPRIGTLTFHHALNYGAVLQCYALQRTIMEMGYTTEVLDYINQSIAESDKLMARDSIRTPKSAAKYLLRHGWEKRKGQRFSDFITEYIRLSPRFTREQLIEECPCYSTVIVGSDQVWNEDITHADSTYYLDFTRNAQQRIAYGVSVGKHSITRERMLQLRERAQRFDAISAREPDLAIGLRDACGVNVPCVCDPVFFLGAEDWLSIANWPTNRDAYLLLFMLSKPKKDDIARVKRYARKRGLRVLLMAGTTLKPMGVDCVCDSGPSEFLGLVASAAVVVTDSYHGMVFSILLNKEVFWLKTRHCPPGDTRASSLFERLAVKPPVFEECVLGDQVLTRDWHVAHERLSDWINLSRDFLSASIGGQA